MINVEYKFEAFEKKLGEASEKATYLVSSHILADCNKHARKDTGDLIKSSQKFSKPEKGELVWDTPYAKRVYFTGTPNVSTNHNPEAQLMWCDYAYNRYHKDWIQIVKSALKAGTK